jgi:hypothetical protein
MTDFLDSGTEFEQMPERQTHNGIASDKFQIIAGGSFLRQLELSGKVKVETTGLRWAAHFRLFLRATDRNGRRRSPTPCTDLFYANPHFGG